MMPITEESKSTTVRFADLEMAYSFVSDTCDIEAAAYVSIHNALGRTQGARTVPCATYPSLLARE